MTPIREWASVTPESFHAEIVPAAKPAVFRGLAADWPVVRAGRKSQGALFDYLKRFDSGKSVRAIAGPPEIGGRFFYNDDLTGFNFKTGMTKLSAALDFLAANAGAETPPALAVQSVSVCESLPEFADENSLTLAPA
ncbi:MAG: cupin-like domain-containing protein, partial [Amphiplicatus sp.]